MGGSRRAVVSSDAVGGAGPPHFSRAAFAGANAPASGESDWVERLRSDVMRFPGPDGPIHGEGPAPAWKQLEEGKRSGALRPAAQVLSAFAAGQTWTSIGPEEMTPPGSEIQT